MKKLSHREVKKLALCHNQNTVGPGFKPRQIGSRVDALSLPVTHSSHVCWEPPWCQVLCWVQRVQMKMGYSAFLLRAESGLRVEHINKQSLDLNPTILDPERGTKWWVGICLSDRKEWMGRLFLENWEKPDQKRLPPDCFVLASFLPSNLRATSHS